MKGLIHKYYKKKFDGLLILIQLDPVALTGVELIIDEEGQMLRTERVFDEDIYLDLDADQFKTVGPMEFNLHLKGLAQP